MKKIFLAVLFFTLAPSFALAAGRINTSINQPNLASGLVGWWTFDGKDMVRNVNDASGNGNNGDLVGFTSTTSVPGVSGQALQLNGSNQYVSVSPAGFNLQDNTSFSIAGWVKTSTAPNETIVDTLDYPNTSGLDFYISSGGLVFLLSNATLSPYRGISGGSNINDGNWHFVVATYNGSQSASGMKLYKDGQAQSILTNSDSAPGALANSFLKIGYAGATFPDPFGGSLDGVRIYNRALSATEVKQMYTASVGDHQNTSINQPNAASGLVGWWTFDGKNMVSNVADSSGQGNNGDLVNFTSTTTVPGVSGQALNFSSAANQYEAIPNLIETNQNNTTLMAWFKTTSGGVIFGYENAAYPGSPNGFIPTVYIGTDGMVRAQLWDGTVHPITSSNVYNDGKWHQATLTVSGGNSQTLYIDGSLIGSLSNTIVDFSATVSQIGTGFTNGWPNANGSWFFFDGSLDGVRIYNRGLSAAEIKQLYNASIGTHEDVTINPSNLNTGLAGHWTFDGKDMIQNVTDSTGGGGNGDLFNFTSTTTAPGVIGQALHFNGTNQRIDVGDNFNWTDDTTLSAWVYPNLANDPTNTGVFLSKGSDKASANGWGIMLNQDGTHFAIQNVTLSAGEAGHTLDAIQTITANRWYLVTGVWDNTNKILTLYINGKFENALNVGAQTLRYVGPSQIGEMCGGGSSCGGTNYPFTGNVDDVRIYHRALSAAEILQLYKLGQP